MVICINSMLYNWIFHLLFFLAYLVIGTWFSFSCDLKCVNRLVYCIWIFSSCKLNLFEIILLCVQSGIKASWHFASIYFISKADTILRRQLFHISANFYIFWQNDNKFVESNYFIIQWELVSRAANDFSKPVGHDVWKK